MESLLHYSILLLLINLCVIRGQVNYFDVLEAQFLSLDDEVKIVTNGETAEKIEKVLTQEVLGVPTSFGRDLEKNLKIKIDEKFVKVCLLSY